MRNLKRRALAVAMAAVLALGSMSYPGKVDPASAAGRSDAVLTDESQLGEYNDKLAYKRVGVHDPSIIQDPETKRYYLFGSHCAWAYSDDLKNWTSFTNNVTEASAVTIFKDEIAWCRKADSSYSVAGNLWAPDIVWSEPMKKWCMYMSINGPDWNSTISLLTADRLDGSWTYVGPVIQSGMTKGYGLTFDLTKVTGETTVPARYTDNVSRGGNPTLEAHAIDPCVVYDDKGDLWMSYGSWSGGISMIKLDPKTGLRDYSTSYKDTGNKVDADGMISDPYTGYKIAGGTAVSGEGSYIQKIGDYYFLFLSYGGYDPKGGYNMRLFRSKDIKGPYLDALGKDARTVVNSKAGDTTGTTGMRLVSFYKWNFAPYGYTAQGHNSAIVDPDSGKAFVIYHNKFNDGTAAHEVRNHQLLVNEDGWILAAPFEYAGETLSEKGYSQELFTGDYGIMFQRQNVDAAKLACEEEQSIRLESGTEVKDDTGRVTGYTGNITGGYEGTWTSKAGTPYVSLKIGATTYKGVFCEGTIDETNVSAMTFTALGDNNQECLWGYKVKDPTQAIRLTLDKQIQLPDTVVKNLTLPAYGVGGSKITWKSNSVAISDDGKVFHLNEDAAAGLTATVSCGGYEYSRNYKFTVVGSGTLSQQTEIPLKTFYKDKELDLSTLKQGQCPSFANPYHDTAEDISRGVVIRFDVTRTAASDRLSNIISFNNKLGKLYFTGGSYLGFNDFNDHFFDANLKSGFNAGTDYLETNKKVTIQMEITAKGVVVSKDGKEIYSTATLKAGTTEGSYSGNNPETTVLSWIKSVPELNFGSGNFWPDLIFKGKISNVVCSYIQPAIAVNGGSSSLNGVYTQDYENVTDVSQVWTSTNAQVNLSIKSYALHGKYVDYDFTGDTKTNSRGAHSYFGDTDGFQMPEKYQLEYDMALKAGNNQSGEVGVVTDQCAYASGNENNGLSGGYIFKLTSQPGSETWTVANAVNEPKTVTIPRSTWVHVTLTATDGGNIKGLYLLAGRYQASYQIDNIALKEQGGSYADLTSYKNVLDRAKQFMALQDKTPCFTTESYQALTGAVDTAQKTVTEGMAASQQDVVDAQTDALMSAINGLKRKICTIQVEPSENGSVKGLEKDGQYNAGDCLYLTAQPAAGYVFSGWKIGSEMAGRNMTYSAVVTDNMTISAVFAKAVDLTEFNKILEEAEAKAAETIYTDESLLALQKAIMSARAEVLTTTEQSVVEKHIAALKRQ